MHLIIQNVHILEKKGKTMKKLSKMASFLAISAMLFGFASCSDGGDDNKPETKPDVTYTGPGTADSWDFTTYANAIWVNPDVAGSIVVKDTSKFDTDGTYTISADASVKGAADLLTLTISKSGNSVGTSTKATNYSYSAGATDGLRFKNGAFKIADIKGKVKLTIEWSCIANKAAGDRNLEVTVGASGVTTSVGNEATTSASSGNVAMTPYTQTISAGNGTDLYIGASNNIFIKTITLEDASDAVESNVSVIIPDLEKGLDEGAVTTTKTYSIGYDSSISAEDLTEKLLADTTLTNTLNTIIEEFQASINEALTAGGAASGAVTVTSSDINFIYFASVEDWKAFDVAEEDSAVETAKAKALNSIDKEATVYVTVEPTEALMTKVAAKIASVGATATADSWNLTGTNITALTVNGYTYAATTEGSSTDYTYTTASAISSNATILASDATLEGSNTTLNLTISKYSGTGKGTTKAGVTTAPNFTETTNNKPGNSISWKADSSKGLLLKRDGLKIEGVKGSVTLTVKWYMNSKKSANDRYLEVTVGDNECIRTGTSDTSTAAADMDDFVLNIDGGVDGVDIYIGASNEIYIKAIEIKETE